MLSLCRMLWGNGRLRNSVKTGQWSKWLPVEIRFVEMFSVKLVSTLKSWFWTKISIMWAPLWEQWNSTLSNRWKLCLSTCSIQSTPSTTSSSSWWTFFIWPVRSRSMSTISSRYPNRRESPKTILDSATWKWLSRMSSCQCSQTCQTNISPEKTSRISMILSENSESTWWTKIPRRPTGKRNTLKNTATSTSSTP